MVMRVRLKKRVYKGEKIEKRLAMKLSLGREERLPLLGSLGLHYLAF